MEQVRTINLEPGNKEEILPGFSEDFPYIATCAVSNGFAEQLTNMVGGSNPPPYSNNRHLTAYFVPPRKKAMLEFLKHRFY